MDSKTSFVFPGSKQFLKSYDRKIYPILGDGNCLLEHFHSFYLKKKISYHQQIRKVLIEILILNSEVFSKYCTDSSLDEHVAHMKYETIWGTDKIRAAASYLQLLIFVCTQKSKSLEYYWDCFFPFDHKGTNKWRLLHEYFICQISPQSF